jgi:hypothetical protein
LRAKTITVVEVRETFAGEVLIWREGRAIALRTPNIIYLFGPLGYKAIFKMRYFKVNFIKIAWL